MIGAVCPRCGEPWEYQGWEFASVFEVVRRYECPECGESTFEITRNQP